MATVKVTRKHNLSKEVMEKKLDALANDPSSTHVSWKHDGNKILLSGKSPMTKGSTGEVVLGENFVAITLNLSMMASFFKDMIEQKLGEQLDELLRS